MIIIKGCSHSPENYEKILGDGNYFYNCKVCDRYSGWYDGETNKAMSPEELFLNTVKEWLKYGG